MLKKRYSLSRTLCWHHLFNFCHHYHKLMVRHMKNSSKELNIFVVFPDLSQKSGTKVLDERNDRTAYKLCRMHNCFDYSRCSLFSPFLLYFYHPEDEDIDDTKDSDNNQTKNKKIISDFYRIRSKILDSFNGNVHVTFDPTIACVYVVILFDNNKEKVLTKDYFNDYFHSLPYWAGIQLMTTPFPLNLCLIFVVFFCFRRWTQSSDH